MFITLILFWVSLTGLFFSYFGYGILLFLVNRFKRTFSSPKEEKTLNALPAVTMIIPAYNERTILEQKIKNTLAIDYPPGLLKIVFVTDGSTDGSELVIRKYPSLLLLHQPERQGKMAAIKRAMQQVQSPVVVFSDANAMLDKECIQKMIRHYSDPKTGGVAGEKKIMNPKDGSSIGAAEGIYWSYESFMKKQDAAFNTVVGAAGELYSIRTELFPCIEDNVILDDFVISMKVCLRGYKIRYEPGAFATELPSASLGEERKRKIRISAGACQSIAYLRNALNIFKYPVLSFQYISRRLLRWVLCPPLLIVLLLTNILIVMADSSHAGYTFFLIAQLFFYLSAITGWLIMRRTRRGKKMTVLTIPFYFVFMNVCQVIGFIKYLKGKQTVLWEKSMRQPIE